MKEDFLHFLWKHQKFLYDNLKTTQGSSLQFVKQGVYNTHTGPDFSDARLKIDVLDWVVMSKFTSNHPIGLHINTSRILITMQ